MNDSEETIINNYYSSVDKDVLNNYKNGKLKNLIYLSTTTDLYLFNKKNKKWQIKNKDKILSECKNIKKKELKKSSNMLSNLAKLSIESNNNIKKIYDNLQYKLDSIDKIMNGIRNLEIEDTVDTIAEKPKKNMSSKYSSILPKKIDYTYNNFIECYSNY